MCKIFLVDDDQYILDALEQILTREGYQVQSAGSGKEALEVISDSGGLPLDLIITDIGMPAGIDGFEFSDIMRSVLLYKNTPIVFISAAVTPEKENRIVSMTNTAWLSKPFGVPDLLQTIKHALHKNKCSAVYH